MSATRDSGATMGYIAVLFVLAAGAAALVWFGIPVTSSGSSVSEAQGFESSPKDPLEAPISRDFSWTNDMVWIPSGTFWRGSESGQSDERPVREISITGFWMDQTEVTVRQYEQFVRETDYVTVAERKPNPEDFPGADPALLVPGSVVFAPPMEPVSLQNHYAWWSYAPGASWRRPEGAESSISGRENFPVVHVCWEDVVAYANWAGKRLPTEAEWEYAARGGFNRREFIWGNDLAPNQQWRANIWQGEFPVHNSANDGFAAVGPVRSFQANGYGLYDMAGNVWEWCLDWYLPDYYSSCPPKDPPGPNTSYDPNEPGVMKKVMRGGSYLCDDSYCSGYRPASRMKSSPDTGLSHTGFRCIRPGPSPEQIAQLLAEE